MPFKGIQCKWAGKLRVLKGLSTPQSNSFLQLSSSAASTDFQLLSVTYTRGTESCTHTRILRRKYRHTYERAFVSIQHNETIGYSRTCVRK